jgi:threonine synthase
VILKKINIKNMSIKYYSTNKNAPSVTLAEALLTGQAPDKGLYMPEIIPQFTAEEINGLNNKPYAEVAQLVLSKYTQDSLSHDKLKELCEDAYNYDVPLEKVYDKKYVMRLDHGPTASFKDFAARMMARLFGALLQDKGKDLIILTATSGDTGSAIAHAFYNIPNIKVMVLFPPKEVSDRQRKQMTTLGNNISIVGIDGKFDDCQALVKQAFADESLNNILLTSANSINVGRILPQIVYYVYAYSQLAENGEEIIFSIPSGNFGNMMGAVIAKQRLVISTNANDEVPNFLSSGHYEKISPSRECISNAMNVGHPSNFARLVDLYNGQIDETGVIHKQPDLDKMRTDLWTISINDDETRQTIVDAWNAHKLLLEPHGAVGWAGLKHYNEAVGDANILSVSVETAHPAKFPDEINNLLSFDPEIPESLKGIEEKQEEYLDLPVDYESFRKLLITKYSK